MRKDSEKIPFHDNTYDIIRFVCFFFFIWKLSPKSKMTLLICFHTLCHTWQIKWHVANHITTLYFPYAVQKFTCSILCCTVFVVYSFSLSNTGFCCPKGAAQLDLKAEPTYRTCVLHCSRPSGAVCVSVHRVCSQCQQQRDISARGRHDPLRKCEVTKCEL